MKACIACLAAMLVLSSSIARAQDHNMAEIARMLVEDMSPTGSMEGGQWFADETGIYGLGMIYVHIPGSAGSVSLHAGIYGLQDVGWVKLRDVNGLFGMSTGEAMFRPGLVEVSTMMLGPNDPRCCPTKKVRWRIDLGTGQAVALN